MTQMKTGITVTPKLPDIKTTVFSVINEKAAQHNAVNLSQGFPDYDCSEKLVELVHKYMKNGYNQYAPMPGVPELREAISQKVKKLYGVDYDPGSEITITAGGAQAIFASISSIISEGDEVIILEPAYDCYAPAIKLNGGLPVFVELESPGFKVNWEGLRKRISSQTKMIVLNTPHNPTGSILEEEDMRKLENIVENTDIVLLSDEVYEHIVFDGKEHHSVMRYPTLAERSFAIFSFGKVFHITGWKLGYCLAPDYLMKEFRKVHQYEVFCCNTPIQHALADFLEYEEEYLSLNDFYQKKRDFFLKAIEDSRFQFTPAGGTYFQLLDYSEISEAPDVEFVEWLIEEHGIASIPLSPFYKGGEEKGEEPPDKFIRFCFAKSDETLQKAADILCQV